MNDDWIRIPVPIAEERDRRELCAILTANGLDCRVVRVRKTSRSTPQRYIEYRDSGAAETQTIT